MGIGSRVQLNIGTNNLSPSSSDDQYKIVSGVWYTPYKKPCLVVSSYPLHASPPKPSYIANWEIHTQERTWVTSKSSSVLWPILSCSLPHGQILELQLDWVATGSPTNKNQDFYVVWPLHFDCGLCSTWIPCIFVPKSRSELRCLGLGNCSWTTKERRTISLANNLNKMFIFGFFCSSWRKKHCWCKQTLVKKSSCK